MIVDYLTLMLANMTAGLIMLGVYLVGARGRGWAGGFAIVGLIAFIGGVHLSFTWPIPGVYAMIFGEASVMLGALFLGAALAIAKDWTLHALGIYALVASLVAILLGVGVLQLGLTARPDVSGAAFVITGIGGLLTGIALILRTGRIFASVAAIVLWIAAGLWGLTGGMSYWMHMKRFPQQTVPAGREETRAESLSEAEQDTEENDAVGNDS
jgi:putative membrane protein